MTRAVKLAIGVGIVISVLVLIYLGTVPSPSFGHSVLAVWLIEVEHFLDQHEKSLMIFSTLAIAAFTGTLWWATTRLQNLAATQGKDMRHSLKIAKKSAYAAKAAADISHKSAMPVLFPWVRNPMGLHPLVATNQTIEHRAVIYIGFDNFGKTPGVIRQVRTNLFLTNDDVPSFKFENLDLRDYEVMIPGDSRAVDHRFGALEFVQSVTLTPADLHQLLGAAETRNYKRFFLAGQVVYDDFFGRRHTSRFCVKLRYWQTSEGATPVFFQVAKGGSRYNYITEQEIPDPDPLTE